MGKLSIEELLEAGIPLEEILAKRDPVKINVDVDLDSVGKALASSLTELRSELSINNTANRELLIKSLQALFKKQDDLKTTNKAKPVTGLKIVRNNLNLITDLKFIRD